MSVAGINYRAASEKRSNHGNRLSLRGEMQWSPPVGVCQIGIGTGLDELEDRAGITVPRRVMQFGAPNSIKS